MKKLKLRKKVASLGNYQNLLWELKSILKKGKSQSYKIELETLYCFNFSQ